MRPSAELNATVDGQMMIGVDTSGRNFFQEDCWPTKPRAMFLPQEFSDNVTR